MGIIFMGMMLGQVGSLAPDFTKAHQAAKWLYTIIEMGAVTQDASQDKRPALTGDVVFKNVSFTYPTRPDAMVFNNLSLTVPAGKTIALVGQSGCGKSTAIALLEKFYKPDAGTITVCGVGVGVGVRACGERGLGTKATSSSRVGRGPL